MRATSVIICTFFLSFAIVGVKSFFINKVKSTFNTLKEWLFFTTREADFDFHIYSKKVGRKPGAEAILADIALCKGKIFFISHGYYSGRNESWYKDLTNRLLDKYEDSVVAQVAWEAEASKFYPISARFTKNIGARIAEIIFSLEIDYKISPERFVLIGHSLGAQISGWAGRFYTIKTGKKIGRIIAMDPAQPSFRWARKSEKLSKNDANVVFVVHTDPILGFWNPCGTVDFFVNGGSSQKICTNNFLKLSFFERFTCDHTSAHTYLIEAITHPKSYIGQRCLTVKKCRKGIVEITENVSMGNLELNNTGLFYVNTPDPVRKTWWIFG